MRSPLGCICGYYLTVISVMILFSVVAVGRGSQYHYLVVSVGSLLSVVSVSQGFLLVVSISINVLVMLVPAN